MANPEHLKILKQGVAAWNRWRRDNPDVVPDVADLALVPDAAGPAANLRGANFSGVDLGEANLVGANLRGAGFGGADLHGALLHEANLVGANLREADLREADLSRADFSEADLSGANLSNANLWRANLSLASATEADFTEAILAETVLADVDLSGTRGLESCKHHGPSILDHRTFAKSGKLPIEFLRGCGLPDSLIDYLPSLLGDAIQFYSCFISYSSKDQDFAERLHADLQDKGVRCWFAPEDLKIGARTRRAIDEAIKVRDKLLLILSERSIASNWVESEVETGFEEEARRKQTVLFPIRLDDTVMKTNEAWADAIRRTRNIGDFTRWKDHDAYQKGFERLIRDLKTNAERKKS